MIPVYYGFDPREEIGSHAFVSSVLHRSSWPVSLIPLHAKLFASFYPENMRDGTNAFTYTRFLIPFLQDYKGWAVFADGADMICRADIAELWALRDEYKDVLVVGHSYKTEHPRKYVGTSMESDNRDYVRKNWSSLMLINCHSSAWRRMTPEVVQKMSGEQLHRFDFISEDRIGFLPTVWNWLADEYGENADAKIVHWTAGIPAFPHYAQAPMADEWAREACRITHATA
jgi:lipopolysaccharide biosynthesis glycosyltransferase